MDLNQKYDHAIELVKAVTNGGRGDMIPIISNAQTWAIGYAGAKTEEAITSNEQEFDVYSKYLIDFDFDGTILFGVNAPLKVCNSLGYSPYAVADDGVTLEKRDSVVVETEELDEFISNPLIYLRDKVLYRRFPKIRLDFPEDYNALKESFNEMLASMQKNQMAATWLKENLGIPMITGGGGGPALDRYVSYRGFQNGMTDMRRFPEKVLDALEAIYPIVAPNPGPAEGYPLVFYPVVTATYLGRKQFEKFWWPTGKRSLDTITSKGGKVLIVLEGACKHIYDLLSEFPKYSMAAWLEKDDMVQAKKDIGGFCSLFGGMDVMILRNGSKEDNVNNLKKILDECGPDGIAITQNVGLISPNDVNNDNLHAAIDFVRSYKF